MKNLILILVGILLFAAVAFVVALLVIQHSNGSVVSGGVKRKYLLYVPPSYDPSTPTPLVISMHGFSDWPAHQMNMSGWNELAAQEGFIAVYPMGTGLPLRWKLYDYEDPQANPTQDILFIADLIDQLSRQYNIDPARIYANGLSNGGGMAQALACTLSERIAAVGSVSGAYLYPLAKCTSGRAVPMIAFHGTADPIVPYNGGSSKSFDIPFPSIPNFIKWIAEINRCTLNIEEIFDGETVSGIRYKGCRENADVVFYSIEDGGHSWPGGKAMPHWMVGETNQEVNATRLMWEFFKEHPLAKTP